MALTSEQLVLQAELELNLDKANRDVAALEKNLKKQLSARAQLAAAGKDTSGLDRFIAMGSKSLELARNKAEGLAEQLRGVNGEAKSLSKSFDDSNSAAGKLAGTLAAVFSVKMAKDFVSKMMSVRGEFQQLEIAFETMLGSKEKADKMMQEAVELAAKTPFDLQGVAAGAKSLLAYGLSSDKVTDTLRRLGDVAAGLSLPLNRLTTVYGQTMVKGKLQTRDLIRYQSAGIPILDELAKMYKEVGNTAGDSANKVRALVTAGKVGFKDVEEVFRRMTSEGGKFNNLMEKQSASITGRISNIQDAIDEMFNEIGKKSEGPIYKGLEMVSKLIENYEKVGKVIAAVGVAYGIERAALMVYVALQKSAAAATAKSTAAKLAEAAATGKASAAQKVLNKAILANPYVLAAAGVAALGVGIYKMATHASAGAKAMDSLKTAENDVTAEAAKELSTLRSLQNRLESAEKGTRAWSEAKKEAVSQFSKYKSNISDEIEKVGSLKNIYDDLAGSIYNAARMRMYQSTVATRTTEIETEAGENIKNLKKRMDFATKWTERKKVGTYREGEGDTAEFGFDVIGLTGEEVSKKLDAVWTNTINHIYDKEAQLSEDSKAFWNNWKATSLRGLFGRFDNLIADAREDILSLGQLDEEAKKAFGITDELLKKYNTSTTDTETPEDKTDKELTRQYNLQKRQAEATKKLSREKLQMEIDAQQREADLMTEGYEKTRALNEVNFKKEMLQIRNQREDKLKELQEEEKAIWMAANPDEKEYSFKTSIKVLPSEYKDMYDQMEEDALDKWVNANIAADDKIAQDFNNHKAKMAAIEREWDERIAQTSDEAQKASYERQKKLEMAKERESFTTTSNGFGRDDRRSALEERLKAELEITKAYYDEQMKTADEGERKMLEQKKALAEAYAKLQLAEFDYSEIAEYGDFSEVIKAITEKFNAQMATLPADMQEGMQFSLQEAVDNFVRQFAESGRDLNLQEFYNNLAGKSIAALERQLKSAKKKLEAIDKGDDAALAEAEKRIKALEAKIRELRGETGKTNLNLADMGQICSEAASQFQSLGELVAQNNEGAGEIIKTLGAFLGIAGTVVAAIAAITAAEATALTVTMGYIAIIGAAIAAIAAIVSIINANNEANERAAESARQYAHELERLNDAAKLDNLKNAFGENAHSIFKQAQKNADAARKAADSYRKSAGTLSADMRSGWQKFWGTKQENIKTVSLASFYNTDGTMDLEKLKAFQSEYGDYLSKEQATLVDDLIQEWERYEAAMEEVNGYLENLFNDTASSIADAMITAFEESGDALIDLTDISNSFGKSLAKSMITSTLMEGVFTKEAQDAIKNMLLQDNAAGAVEYYNRLLEQANAKAPEISEFLRGLNLDWDADERTGEQKGIAQASQDSVDELNGRATVIQSHSYQINESVLAIREQNGLLLSASNAILSEVRGIHDDTRDIKGQLSEVAAQNAKIRSNVEWIIDKGVRVN